MEQPRSTTCSTASASRRITPASTRTTALGLTTWSPLASAPHRQVPRWHFPTTAGPRSTDTAGSGTRSRRAVPRTWCGRWHRRRGVGLHARQLAIAWVTANPHVSTVITGASRESQVVENLAALDVIDRLTPELMARIHKITKR
ncbi:MAG: aldo/keto reductase [Ilumatobacteraceae bacterium]